MRAEPKFFRRKNHTLLHWITGLLLILLGICAVFLLIFARVSMNNLLSQEIEKRKAVLKLHVDNIDGNLSSLQGYLEQNFTDSAEILTIETETDETKLFMAKQSLVRNMGKIAGWNESLLFLFLYSPGSEEKTFLPVSSRTSDYEERLYLQNQIKSYIDEQLKAQERLGRGFLLLENNENGYLVRFYKIRNSYLGMCLDSQEVLKPLAELTGEEGCLAFLADVNGKVVSHTKKFSESIDVEDNGKIWAKKGQKYLQLNYLSDQEDFYIGTWTSATLVTEQFRWMRNLIILFVAGFFILMAVLSFTIRKSLYKPILSMEKAMKRVGDGQWDLALKEDSRILEYSSMIHNFNEMVSEIKDLKIQNYEKELAAQKAYLLCLQLQINPHFYLNALNIIYSLAEVQNYELIQEMTMSLVEYSRYTFTKPDKLVTVSQEMEHVNNYMKIQNMRFPDKIEYQANISSEIEDAMIPPFAIQSFVENSVKYAVQPDKKNQLSILGHLNEIENELYIEIEIRDNGAGYSEDVLAAMNGTEAEDERYNVGIRNVRERLGFIFEDRAKVILRNENGAVTLLQIPLVWKEDVVK